MQKILQDLNKEQLEAVLYDENSLLLLAGAGTGKTKVLTSKIAYLIKTKMAQPSEILAVTFTNKAANSMKEKIENLTGLNINSMWVGTFHSIAYRILKQYCNLIAVNRNFNIINQSRQLELVEKIMKNFVEASDPKEYVNAIGRKKNKTIKNIFGFVDLPEFNKIFKSYEETLKTTNSLDFDDLIINNIKLLKKYDDVKNHFNEQFKYILVDEYQDINGNQYEWLKLMLGEDTKLTCVGDDDQSIYGWRGADVSYILNFKKNFRGTKILKLEKNYRSTSNILETANGLIINNRNRHEKSLYSADKNFNGEKVKLIGCSNNIQEVFYVINEIIFLKKTEKIHSFNDVAILVRINRQIDIFKNIFSEYNIPYKITGENRFSERNEFLEKENNGFIKEGVNIMTMHVAKGLEFEAVFLPNWNSEIIKAVDENNEEEERRLAYVAMTRARSFLYISYESGETTGAEPLKFVYELPKKYVEFINKNGKMGNNNLDFSYSDFDEIAVSSSKSNYTDTSNEAKKCNHKTFGEGYIVKEDGDNLTIVFKNYGKKIIRRGFVIIENF